MYKKNTKRNRTDKGALEKLLDWLEPFFVFFFDALFFIITLPIRIFRRILKLAMNHKVLAVGTVLCSAVFVLIFAGCRTGEGRAYAAPDIQDVAYATTDLFEAVASDNYLVESSTAKDEELKVVTETADPVIDELASDAESAETSIIEECGDATTVATEKETDIVVIDEYPEAENSATGSDHSSTYLDADGNTDSSTEDQIQSGDAPLVADSANTVVLSPDTFVTEETSVASAVPGLDFSAADSDASIVDEVSESEPTSWTNDEISMIAADMGYYSELAPIAMAGMQLLVNEYGFTREGAAGLMGNAFAECTYFVGADNGSHFGIFQWDYYDRWPRIAEYLESIGCIRTSRYDYYGDLSLDQQIEVFLCQLRASLESSDAQYYTSTIESCRSASDASSAADTWRIYYEGCGDQATQARRDGAVRALNLYNAIF